MRNRRKKISDQIDGPKLHVPKDRTKTRFNAIKHGLLAIGITELDDAEGYYKIARDLIQQKNPVGILETKLLEAAALDMVRWARARRLEAEYITAVLNPVVYDKNLVRDLDLEINGEVLDPGIPAALGAGNVHQLVTIFQRYETFFANRLFRTIHEVERLQRMRLGERLPAPTAVDISIRTESGPPGSVPVKSESTKVLPKDEEVLPASAIADNTHAEPGTEDSGHAESESEGFLSPNRKEEAAGTVDSVSGEVPVRSGHAESEAEKVCPPDRKNFEAVVSVDIAKGDSSIESGPPERDLSTNGKDVSAAETADGKVRGADSTRVAWKPRVPSGPIWSRR